ncbi:MAG TPA: PAS domain S-box protein [Candidatus Methanoperedens sp.]|nr:PAS domain S-box protein [Candidatus Methanoperedens sp.]
MNHEDKEKKTEEALREAEARYRGIFENAVEGIFQTTPDGHFLAINPALARMLGYSSPGELMAEVTDARQFFIDPERRQEFIRLMKENGIVTGFENPVRRKGGSKIWVSENVRALRDSSGRLAGYEGMAVDITERKRAERELMAEKEKLDSIVHGIGAGLSLLDSDARLIWANDIWQGWFGPIEELKGKLCHELYDLTEPEKECSALCTLRSGEIERGESFAEIINGEKRYYQLTTAPIKDDEGKIIQMVELTQDITERKRAEEALLESEKRYRSLFEDSPNSLWEEDFSEIKKHIDSLRVSGVKDFRTYFSSNPEDVINCARMVKVVDVNKATLELYKAKSKEELLSSLRIVFGEASDEAFREELISIAEGKPRFEIEAVNRTLTGEKKNIALRWSMAPEHEARWSKVLVSVIDSTERKRAEEALRESEIKFRSITQAATDAIISADSGDNIISWNKGAQTVFGYTEEEALGKPLTIIMPERYWDAHKKGVERVNSTGETRIIGKTVGLIGMRNDGSEFPLELSLSSWKTEKRRLYSGIIRDVTERKSAEEKLKQTMIELERSNKDLEQFAYAASHDLQEPLRTVANFSQLLAKRYKGELDSKADQFIGFIVDGATRMQQMIEDLLAYSRVSTRAKPFQMTDCENVLNQALANLKVAIEESKALVTHDPLPEVMADSSQMAQLFQNLISNAIKFTKEKPSVHVSASQSGNEWFFSVQDNGIGIAPEFMEHIFKMFQREHTSAEYPGTGVGLAICKKIVERHGGRIWIKSEQGRGSTFHFTIPAREIKTSYLNTGIDKP